MDTIPLHKLNAGYTWTDHAPPYRLVTTDQAGAFDRDGAFLLKGALDTSLVADVEAAIDPYEAEATRALQDSGGQAGISRASEITFFAHLAARLPACKTLATSAPIVDLCLDLLGPDVRLYWDQLVYKKPTGHQEFPFHQDNGYIYVEPQLYLTCWVPLTKATVENGCPWIWPGVHRLGTIEHTWTDIGWVCKQGEDGAIALEADVGDIVVFSSLTPHRTGPNLTTQVRKAYILQFAPDGARWIENSGSPDGRLTCDHPDNQFFITKGGRPAVAGQ